MLRLPILGRAACKNHQVCMPWQFPFGDWHRYHAFLSLLSIWVWLILTQLLVHEKNNIFCFQLDPFILFFISIIFSWMRQYQRAPSSVKEMKNCFSLSKLHFLILKQASAKVVSGCLSASSRRNNSGKAPEKIECFVDGKKVLVDPGTTVLQVLLPFSFKNLLSSLFLG